jgi:hypothetical protein
MLEAQRQQQEVMLQTQKRLEWSVLPTFISVYTAFNLCFVLFSSLLHCRTSSLSVPSSSFSDDCSKHSSS